MGRVFGNDGTLERDLGGAFGSEATVFGNRRSGRGGGRVGDRAARELSETTPEKATSLSLQSVFIYVA